MGTICSVWAVNVVQYVVDTRYSGGVWAEVQDRGWPGFGGREVEIAALAPLEHIKADPKFFSLDIKPGQMGSIGCGGSIYLGSNGSKYSIRYISFDTYTRIKSVSSTYFSRYKRVRVSLYYIENTYTQYRSYRFEVFNLPLYFSHISVIIDASNIREASPMSKKNRRRISTCVSAQTLYHLENMRQFCGFNDIGRVIDKIVREKQIELKEGVRSHAESKYQNRRQNW